MLFNSIHFFVYLVVVLLVSALLRRLNRQYEIWFLVAASAYFYGQWNWSYLILIYVTIIADYFIGQKCFQHKHPQKFLNISLIVNLGILGFFKYANFFLDTANGVVTTIGYQPFQLFDFLLPVGISFYTFQSLSYTIDINRNQLKPRKKFSEYALFVSFFPQLVAGPIVRASEFFDQLDKKRNFSFAMAQSGVMLIMLGLVKKVVFADNLALFADPVFDHPEAVSGVQTLLAVYAFAFQIYFDFSGYTDIAIGVAKLLGFTFPKNFNHPYLSLSFQDFWRRWHMTLSRWLRDYLYISLGGNKSGAWKTKRNLFLTMFLGGLWHGASWNFAIWGVLHGLYLSIERSISKKFNYQSEAFWFKSIKWLLVFHFVCFAWIFFRASNFEDSMIILSKIMVLEGSFEMTINNVLPVSAILMMPVVHWLGNKFDIAGRSGNMNSAEYITWQLAFAFALLLFYSVSNEAFIYFQF